MSTNHYWLRTATILKGKKFTVPLSVKQVRPPNEAKLAVLCKKANNSKSRIQEFRFFLISNKKMCDLLGRMLVMAYCYCTIRLGNQAYFYSFFPTGEQERLGTDRFCLE